LEKIGIAHGQRARSFQIVTHAGGDELRRSSERHALGTVALEQRDDFGKTFELRFDMHPTTAVRLYGVRIGAVLEQPGDALHMPLPDGVAEQIVERGATIAAADSAFDAAPAIGLAARFAVMPEDVEPSHVVALDAGVIEHLRVERIGAARDEQLDQFLGARMFGAARLALADHPAEQSEGILPIVAEARGGIGAMVEQEVGDLDRMELAARQSAIGEIKDRLPLVRSALFGRSAHVAREPASDFVKVAARHCGMDRVTRQPREAAADAGRSAVLVLPCEPQRLVDQFGRAAPRVGDRFDQVAPTRQAVVAGDGELDVAQAGLDRRVGQDRYQSSARTGVARAQCLEPGLGFLLEAFEIGIGRERTAHWNAFLPLSRVR